MMPLFDPGQISEHPTQATRSPLESHQTTWRRATMSYGTLSKPAVKRFPAVQQRLVAGSTPAKAVCPPTTWRAVLTLFSSLAQPSTVSGMHWEI
jgi:hypothetical protein